METVGGQRQNRKKRPLFRTLLLYVLAASILLTAGSVISFLANVEDPVTSYNPLSGDFFDNYSELVSVAHNSGNREFTGQRSVNYNADVVEIDVRFFNGQLRAAHNAPVSRFGPWFSNAPTLGRSWQVASGASAIKLDLKDDSASTLARLVSFLRAHEDPDTQVIISSRSEHSLEYFREEYPAAQRFLSVSSTSRLESLIADPETTALVDGITAPVGILSEDTAIWFNDHDTVVYAWTVNDLETLNRMASWGVDGIITDNLAIIELLAIDND